MAAEVLSLAGVQVDLYDAKPSIGRKFLVAGKGGLNLTHSEPYDLFLTRYGERRPQLEPLLKAFGPDEVRRWAGELGFDTFVGSSGRVFPSGLKAAPLLRAWQQRLRAAGVTFHLRHRWLGWSRDDRLRFDTPQGEITIQTEALILALGGGSWPQLGSTGEWVPVLQGRGVPVAPLKPANCGFDVAWSDHFRTKYEGHPVKPVVLSFTGSQCIHFQQQGEFVITRTGLEGSLIYAVSGALRDEIDAQSRAVIYLDLAPDWPLPRLVEKLARPRGSRTLSSHLSRTVGIQGVIAGLLREVIPRHEFDYPERLAAAIKQLPVVLVAARPLEEAISSAGGVLFEALDERLMLRSMPGVFCAGEMLDWEAPTGGYLLTACFASGRTAGQGALAWLNQEKLGE
jgi:hypothetical protein